MLDDLKEVEKFLKICRKQGITEISFEGITAKFGDLPQKQTEETAEEVSPDALSEDQLMFYHVGQT